MATKRNLTFLQGDDYLLELTLIADGQPANLAGITSARWQVKKSRNAEPVIAKSLGNGLSVVAPSGGRVNVEVHGADTESLKGEFQHELEVVDSGGRVKTFLQGVATIAPTIIKNS